MANNYLAQGCNTNSKHEKCYSYNARKGKTDWTCGLGSQLDGWYINKCITQPQAEILAKTICTRWGYDRVKFTSSGSEACSAAVRIARAYTKKTIIFQCGYHGHHDWAVSNKEPSNKYIPFQHVHDFASLKDLINGIKINKDHCNIAAVIVEPLQLDDTFKNINDCGELLRLCKRLKIVSIFDEIITGLRYPTGLYSTAYNLKPDLICMGKAAGNGLPISWVMGSKKLMDNPDYFISSTHAGNEYCCSIAKIMIDKMTDSKLQKFWDTGKKFKHEICNILLGKEINIEGYPTRGEWQGDLDLLTAFWELMAERGHLLGRAFFLNLRHTESMRNKFLKDLKWAITQIDNGYKRKGRCVQFSFKRN